ncbi:L-histidine N(alpha)-methyltransferase [Lignipirellula cremea]|uniref:Histidine-specific methyltransferase EgtD n=1 Tax=Lignipirellula cremea TaxID=2528010 RepID=A0A518DTC3_9BACT|nr:L-histidine N(alpha)-methyltransferase [Lignipirellula cremea]QDU95048.1 Histidine-specific methyltransferase EgtD [Lignipirellula cremea]
MNIKAASRSDELDLFSEEVRRGLRDQPKRLPCKYFYDEHGSQLFDQICLLDEYYLTRCELEIMQQYAGEMAAQIGERVMLVEYGSGSSVKTRILLDHLEQPVAYAPVDISEEHLEKTARKLALAYPQIDILPVCADFTKPLTLPDPPRPVSHKALYFPGSTIGNFEPDAARRLLAEMARLVGPGGGLLIGFDLKKSPEVIEAAYNDAEKVTEAFNLNLLERINRELDSDFQVDQFRHRAVYNEQRGRVEIALVSEQQQQATIDGETFSFAAEEPICTEYSHKYSIEQFSELAASVGFIRHRHWTDRRGYFAVAHLVVE